MSKSTRAHEVPAIGYPDYRRSARLGLRRRTATGGVSRVAARAANPAFKAKRVDPGEAECAAVAIERGWELWSDDSGIVALMRTLHPHLRVERLCGLLVRAVRAGLIPCTEAEHLYNAVFKGDLVLWTTLSLPCEAGNAICR